MRERFRAGWFAPFSGVRIQRPRVSGEWAPRSLLLCLGLAVCLAACSKKPAPPPPDGAALFTKKCSNCHASNNGMRAPASEALRQMSSASILRPLETGR